MEILKNIAVKIDPHKVKKALRLKRDREAQRVQRLIDMAQNLITPKAAYKLSYIEEKLPDAVIVDGLRLESKVLRKNLDAVERIFPYVVSIGPELEQAAAKMHDLIETYYLDAIGNIALTAARQQLHDHMCKKFVLKKMSFMSPGSLQDWPLEAQSHLFQLLTRVEDAMEFT